MCLILWLRRLKQPILSQDNVKQLMTALYDAPVNARSFYVSSQLVMLGQKKRTLVLSLLNLINSMCQKGNVGLEREIAATVLGPALCQTRVDLCEFGGMRQHNTAVSVVALLLE
jgi:hypothetical protein